MQTVLEYAELEDAKQRYPLFDTTAVEEEMYREDESEVLLIKEAKSASFLYEASLGYANAKTGAARRDKRTRTEGARICLVLCGTAEKLS